MANQQQQPPTHIYDAVADEIDRLLNSYEPHGDYETSDLFIETPDNYSVWGEITLWADFDRFEQEYSPGGLAELDIKGCCLNYGEHNEMMLHFDIDRFLSEFYKCN